MQMKILRRQAGIQICGSGCVVARDIESTVVHDVIKINSDAESMSSLDDLQELSFGPVACANGTALVFITEIERIE